MSDYKVSLFNGVNPVPIRDISISEYFERIKNPDEKTKKQILAIRKGKKELKNSLLAITPGATFNKRGQNEVKEPSGLICLDFDKTPPGELAALKDSLIFDSCVVGYHDSPSGNGLKVFIRIQPTNKPDEFKKIYSKVLQHYDNEFLDKAPSNISSLCFNSWDPEIYINLDAEVFESLPGSETLKNKFVASGSGESTIFEYLLTWVNNSGKQFIEGRRHEYILSLSGACCRFGIEKETALELMENQGFISTDYPLKDFKRDLNSAYKEFQNKFGSESFGGNAVTDFERGERQKADEEFEELKKDNLNPFPIAVFPEIAKNYLLELEQTLGFNSDYSGVTMLSTIAVAGGSAFGAEFKNTWIEKNVFFFALVGKPGTGKTAPVNHINKPISKRDLENYSVYSQLLAEFEYYNSLTKKQKEDEIAPPMGEPSFNQLITSDTTPESIIKLLSENPGGFVVMVDEILGWIKGFNRYNTGGGEQQVLSMFSRTPITVNRKTGKTIYIAEPHINIIGGIQPAALPEMLGVNRTETGFADRFLWAYPDDQEKKPWSDNELNVDFINQWEKVINKLLAFRDNEEVILKFDPEAKKYLMDWQRDLTDYLNKPENDSLKSIYAKLETYAIRFSLLMEIFYYACDEGKLKSITLRSAKASTELIKYFLKTALKVHSSLSGADLVKTLPLIKQRVFDALPDEFKTSEGYKIGINNEMTPRTFDRFIHDDKLFMKVKKGFYKKIN